MNWKQISSSSGTRTLVTVESVYPTNGSNWNSYVLRQMSGASPNTSLDVYHQTDSPCLSSTSYGPNACIHGGEKKKVSVTGKSSCSGLTLTESLNAFNWVCSSSSGTAIFYTEGLKEDYGLGNLVSSSGWLQNSVTITDSSGNTWYSSPSAWWANTVYRLPANSSSCTAGSGYSCIGTIALLDNAGAVYVLDSGVQQTMGYNITADRVSVVTSSSSYIQNAAAASNCNATAGTSAPTNICVIAGTGHFLWIEGNIYGATSPTTHFGVFLYGSSRAKIKKANFQLINGSAGYAINLINTKAIDIRRTRIANSAGGISGNAIIYSNFYSLLIYSVSSNVIYLINGSYNIGQNLTLPHNGSIGLYLSSPESFDVFTNTLIVDSNGTNSFFINSASSNVLSNFIVANNGGTGIGLSGGTNNNFNNIVSTNNTTYGISESAATTNKFTGSLLVGNNTSGDCYVTGGSAPGLLTSTCADNLTDGIQTYAGQTSSAVLRTSRSLANSFVGRIASQDSTNESNVLGLEPFASMTDWFQFSSLFRAWGPDTATTFNTTRGYCFSGNCRIFDWRLAASDTVILNRTGDGSSSNSSYSSGAACPTEVNGNRTTTTPTSITYLTNAVEVMGDVNGNNNSLCESGETCYYTPNFGPYQGDYTSSTYSTCTFSNGTISNVTMYIPNSNGI